MFRLVLTFSSAILFIAPPVLAQRMIACDSGRALFEINISDGSATQIGSISQNAGRIGALAYDDANNIVYLSSSSLHSLFTLDVKTGEATLIGEYGEDITNVHGLEFDSSSGTLYAVDWPNNDVYTVNVSTGVATRIGSSGLTSFTNIGYDSDGEILYAANVGTASLYSMNRTSGATTLIGPLQNSTNPTSLAYNPDDGKLYMFDNATYDLYWLNVSTGTANTIGSPGQRNILGLVYVPGPPSVVTLNLNGLCPGVITLSWDNATPASVMGILFASQIGDLEIPGGPCAGTILGLSALNLQLVNTINSGSGSGQVNGNAGSGACGGYLQLVIVDGNPCSTSNVAQLP